MIISSREQIDNKKILVMTSIGGSPIHEGHTRVIRDCKPKVIKHLINKSVPEDPEEYYQKVHVRQELVGGYELWMKNPNESIKLLVIVNCDDFLIRKHGFVFQNEDSRAEIIDAIKDVDYTYIHQSDKQTIDDAIHYFQPHYFCKGGDRSSISAMPECEVKACEDYGTVLLFGVGGSEKISSSSDLIRKSVEHYRCEFDEDYAEVCNELSIILCDIMYRPKIADKLGL